MKSQLCYWVATATVCFFTTFNFAQAPNLGTAAGFVLFTTSGAVTIGTSANLTGDVGTNDGAYTSASTVHGTIHIMDTQSGQCKTDIMSAYNAIINPNPPNPISPINHGVLFGSETLTEGTYVQAAASTLSGVLTLDGQNNPNAVFIFKIGGAFSTDATAQVLLTNHAQSCNVFWVVEGAITIVSGASMKGTMIANNGAINITGGMLEGRAFSIIGAVNVDGLTANIPTVCQTTLPIELLDFTAKKQGVSDVQLNWASASELHSDRYNVERSFAGEIWSLVGSLKAAGTSSTKLLYTYLDETVVTGDLPILSVYYRLKMIDLDQSFQYSPIRSISFETKSAGSKLFPNPTHGETHLSLQGVPSDANVETIILDVMGREVLRQSSRGGEEDISIAGLMKGVYYLRSQSGGLVIGIIQKLIVY